MVAMQLDTWCKASWESELYSGERQTNKVRQSQIKEENLKDVGRREE